MTPSRRWRSWSLGKERILELYLNVIEWGPGVCGAEAAARYHYDTAPGKLARERAARLAAIIPAPRRRDPRDMDRLSAVHPRAHGRPRLVDAAQLARSRTAPAPPSRTATAATRAPVPRPAEARLLRGQHRRPAARRQRGLAQSRRGRRRDQQQRLAGRAAARRSARRRSPSGATREVPAVARAQRGLDGAQAPAARGRGAARRRGPGSSRSSQRGASGAKVSRRLRVGDPLARVRVAEGGEVPELLRAAPRSPGGPAPPGGR